MEKTQSNFYSLIALIVVLVIAFFAWRVGFHAGFDSAKRLVENSSLGESIRTYDDVRTLSGVVTAVNGSSITLRTISDNPFDSSPNERTILIATSTKITKSVLKDPRVLQSEIEDFAKAAQESATEGALSATPPTPSTQTLADSASITVGSRLLITSYRNIKSLREFTADEIQIQVQLLTAPAGAT